MSINLPDMSRKQVIDLLARLEPGDLVRAAWTLPTPTGVTDTLIREGRVLPAPDPDTSTLMLGDRALTGPGATPPNTLRIVVFAGPPFTIPPGHVVPTTTSTVHAPAPAPTPVPVR